MANFYFLVFLLLATSVNAASPALTFRNGDSPTSTYYSTPEPACSDIAIFKTAEYPQYPYTFTGNVTSNYYCLMTRNINGSISNASLALTVETVCLSKGKPVQAVDGQCPLPPPDLDQTCTDIASLVQSTLGNYEAKGRLPDTTCQSFIGLPDGKGCVIQPGFAVAFQKPDKSWVTEFGSFTFPQSPSSCTLDTPSIPSNTPTTSVPDTCPKGQPGQVNGVYVCIPYPPGGTTTTAPTTSSSSSTSTTSTTPNSSPGSTTTSSTTTCASGVCTTSTIINTVNNPSTGGPPVTTSTTTTTTVPKPSFCENNPKDKQCNSSDDKIGSASGRCDLSKSSTTCDGDAILCYVAAESARTACALNSESPESLLYGSSKGATPSFNASTVDISSSISSSPILGSSQCIADKMITVMSKSITLPFSIVCPYLSNMKSILISLAFLISAVILFRT